jgi:2'-hydroxyisoflavone reductase
MPHSRRSFLLSTVAGMFALPRVAGASPTRLVSPERPGSRQALRILFLGGTGFNGPHMVRVAMERGHAVSLFTRGRTNPGLFPKAEKLVGDRAGDLAALRGKRWDVVIDNSGYVPAHVRASAELLRDNVGHYFYTSTIDAYRDFHTANITEDYPLAVLPAGEPHDPRRYYGPLKALCEAAVRDVYPGRHTIVRPGWIVGPGDNNHLFTYWCVRIARGGEVLAPGTPDDPAQVIDARDLADWVIAMIEKKTGGAYNATGPVMTIAEMLYGVRAVTTAETKFTWVDKDFLWEKGVKPYFDLPLWWPPDNDYGERTNGLDGGIGAFNLSGAKAVAAGLRHRALADVAQDTLQWYRSEHNAWPEDRRPGLAAGRERELLEAWHNRAPGAER